METAIEAVQEAHRSVSSVLMSLATSPQSVADDFARIQKLRGSDSRKGMLGLDHTAETACRKRFLSKFKENLQFVGEESLSSFARWNDERYCVLVDMVDGTDLLEMGLNLWCSAIIIFDRLDRRIIGSVIGLPSGEVFHAQEGENGANIRVDDRDYSVSGCSDVTKLQDARICFYGQKLDRLFALAENAKFREKFNSFDERERDVIRVYNFAGNPMLAKLTNRPKGDDDGEGRFSLEIADHEADFRAAFEAEALDDRIFVRLEVRRTTVVCLAQVLLGDAGELLAHAQYATVPMITEDRTVRSAYLACLSVTPPLHKKGLGSLLVRYGLNVLRLADFEVATVLGDPAYYPRFGFSSSLARKIEAPHRQQGPAFMAVELVPGALAGAGAQTDFAGVLMP
ncbi:MAG: hypothetical protein P4M11_09835 [Candidatus Pacebacteria bacterium]|nr:hypothetical protein [Candidatus Paceibacterota bacterium]